MSLYHTPYVDGWKSGRADARLGWRSDYAWYGISVETPGTYAHDYSIGYRAGWLFPQEEN